MGPIYYLSLYDLMKVEGFARAYGEDDKEAIEEILWTNGLDTNDMYTEEEAKAHRALTSPNNEPVVCNRYVGGERTDLQWISSPHASLEAKIASSGDLSLMTDLKNMNRQGFSSVNQYDSKSYSDKHEEAYDKIPNRK